MIKLLFIILLMVISASLGERIKHPQNLESKSIKAIDETGRASYYSDYFNGKRTASGELYQHNMLTAAHKTLPFGTLARVTCQETKKSVIVRINDRGPFTRKRIIDLSKSAFQSINTLRKGEIIVAIEVLAEPHKE